jgi:glycerol uptake facilitator protein
MNGYAINPARDFAPRMFAVLAGFTHNGFTDSPAGSPDSPLAIWTIPILGPVVGGLLGGFAYDLFIGKALVKAHEMKESDRASGEDPSYRERAVQPAEEHHNGH